MCNSIRAKKLINFVIIALFLLIVSGCASTPSVKTSDAKPGPTMRIWVSPDYRADSVYIEMPVKLRSQ